MKSQSKRAKHLLGHVFRSFLKGNTCPLPAVACSKSLEDYIFCSCQNDSCRLVLASVLIWHISKIFSGKASRTGELTRVQYLVSTQIGGVAVNSYYKCCRILPRRAKKNLLPLSLAEKRKYKLLYSDGEVRKKENIQYCDKLHNRQAGAL